MDDPAMEPLMAADAVAHARRRFSASKPSSAGHDTAKPRSQVNDAGMLDPDTCRICRGEATAEEPLFYPCKCSGSIKYVHQDCLMEWLSHSQKKHCELCKTPFRFTKLYSPKMPKTLPAHVFVGHMAKYLFRNVLVWLRAALVISVWLCWLPYLMRSVWAFLFWVSDEGLGSGALWNSSNATVSRGVSVAFSVASSTVCPASPLLEPTTTPANLGGMLKDMIQGQELPFSRSFHGVNITTNDSMSAALLRMLLGSITSSGSSNSTLSAAGNSDPVLDRHPSLLSGVRWLRNLTRYPVVNRTVIGVLEGQIITILVIISFILVILVRDYVVQQQPEINMRAAFAANDNPQPQPHPHPQEHNGHERGHNDAHHAQADDFVLDHDHDHQESDDEDLESMTGGHYGSEDDIPMNWDDQEPTAAVHEPAQLRPFGESRPRAFDGANADFDFNKPLEPAPNRDTQTPVATVHEYLRIYRQAGGDPEKILKIIEEEELDDTLGYWARITRSMIDKNSREAGTEQSNKNEAGSEGPSNPRESQPSPQAPIQLPAPSTPQFSWPPNLSADSGANGDAKGKGKEAQQETGQEFRFGEDGGSISRTTSFQSPLRPRSVSDGPQRNEFINPLANNSWSFSNLNADPPAEAQEPTPIPRPAPQLRYQGFAESSTPPIGTPIEFGFDRDAGLGRLPPPRHDETFEDQGPELGPVPADFVGPRQDTDTREEPLVDVVDAHGEIQETEDGRVAQRPPLQRGVMDRVADFMWGGIEVRELDIGRDGDEAAHENDDDSDEEFDDLDDDDQDDAEQDREVVEAAVAAGLDPEAIDDAEDFEGIMELIGMRGPIAGLFQNAIFCVVLVSVTIFVCVFLPYNLGRVSVWAAMNPMRLVRMLFSMTKFIQDLAVGVMTGFASLALSFIYTSGRMMGFPAGNGVGTLMMKTFNLFTSASSRVLESLTSELPIISTTEMQNFSAISHEALLNLKAYVSGSFVTCGDVLSSIFDRDLITNAKHVASLLATAAVYVWNAARNIPVSVLNPGSWVISFSVPEPSTSVNPALSYWSGADRFWAILCGYFTFSAISALYLRRGSPFSTGQTGQEWEASLIDLLNQASGVMKVILIISIEMLIFPLYCGLLLDVALLPLFEDTTLKSRVAFTMNYPLTSIFVHWFVGTGYMFHFALFVSMCRKIMRKGVLYFIRDPDDPEFHPVRDVLERNVMTQLRKILFSAFVYGALVIICLGGVVWGLALTLPNVLPIHYSSNEPVLEFPVDLLFYNFAMPLAVKFFKPSDGLHAMYTWWFRKCARGLRLTWFLFGERRIDEEGILALRPGPDNEALPWWKRCFLEVNKQNKVVPKTWEDTFEGGTAKPASAIANDQMTILSLKKATLVDSGQLIEDGHYVRTPASDQVKIPKGRRVFMPVLENNTRLDGKNDSPDTDLYSTDQYQLVYIPPHFRVRVFLFIMFIWLFAAVTGVSFTIVPLVFGRKMFKVLIPAHIRTNDIYAFSIGIYILGSLAYFLFHARSIFKKMSVRASSALQSVWHSDAPMRFALVGLQAAKLVYAYSVLLVVFPLILTALMELYCLIPLHTYMYPPTPYVIGANSGGQFKDGIVVQNQHTTRVIQSWTLGLLYVKLGARAITSLYEGTRMAQAVRAVLRRGWLQPDVLVLTRAFVLPGLIIGGLAIFGPPYVVGWMESHGVLGTPAPAPHELKMVYRLSYPAAAFSALAAVAFWSVVGIFSNWKARIRDEAYLIGERLHNFGVGAAGAAGARGPWRVRGRL
ncbi:e3 ubiquitin-protein ligase march6 [Colletotrichum truncatum]|uniref:E3 ubiquitin-protein ligase march6 n=1 Tax=Colletotrichum truncatum TaxID=5467 RepID=A0ACC3YKC8_COLTU|nr:e3 ubiquitin-protein ligase march6 [Colletotrichum truncatum]KAF6784395.1 e3 ubiquitin-protein ligase march6 [Colletotrichum truncatum]